MPDKNRHRKGRHNAKPERTVEDEIRDEYRRIRRNTWWWGNDRGGWPNIWMTLAKKYEMPIVAIKNIVAYQGITDRPLPAPLTPEEHLKRQYHKGEQMVQDLHRKWARNWLWAEWEKKRDARNTTAGS